jgi:hypothetical protein
MLMSLFCAFLISITCFTSLSVVSAQSNGSSVGAVLSSSGVINYTPTPSPTPTATPSPTPQVTPLPTPTPTPMSTNLAVMPEWCANPWRGIGGDFDEGTLTYPVTAHGNSNCFKISPNAGYISYAEGQGWTGLNEVNCGWTGSQWVALVSPGDHVIWRAWVWVDPSTAGQTAGGLALGADMFDVNGNRVTELCPHDGQGYPFNGRTRIWAPWGSTGWVELWMEFDILSTYYGDGQGGPMPTHFYSQGEPCTSIGRLVPWFNLQAYQSGWQNEHASAYVWGMEFYINP